MTALLLAAALLAPPPRASAPAAAAAAAPSTPVAPPAAGQDLEEALAALLGGIHRSPSPAQWRALGPGALAPLLRLAADPVALPSRRARAVQGLSHLGGAEARAAVAALAGDDAQPFSVRAAALEGAARLLPPAQLAAALAPVLERARRPTDRVVAAEVLAAAAPEQCGAVRARAAREGPAERAGFARALARCAAAGR